VDYATRYSRHGFGVDVRQTYAHLPFQPFWTWVTGKDHRHLEPRRPVETLLKEWQLWCQLLWSWSIIILSVWLGSLVYHAADMNPALKAGLMVVAMVLVVSRTRGLLHTFHYTNHGASIRNMDRARWIAKYFMSIPIMHLPWDNYHAIHARDHHAVSYLCTQNDPDEVFMTEHYFRMGMSEREFWIKLVLMPFHPKALWNHIRFRLEQNFIKSSNAERFPRAVFWIGFFSIGAYAGVLEELAIFYLFPLFVLTQFSSWLQHTTEHLWFAKRPEDVSTFTYYGSMTWGRFLGRPHPGKGKGVRHMLLVLRWWALTIMVDLPIRIFAFMQDLPSHDFHHRSPKVNFWAIARERAAHEGRPSRFGPMAETWGLVESWRILRDHLCRDQHDPFGLWAWDREQQEAEHAAKHVPVLAAE
jgi:hypothetical protein